MIIHPIKHRNWYTETKIKWLIVASVFLGSVLPLVMFAVSDIVDGQCEGYKLFSRTTSIIMGLANLCLMVIAPVVLIVYVYISIFVRIRKQRKSRQQNKSAKVDPKKAAEMNMLKTMCIVGICYCFSHFPRMIGVALFAKGNLTPKEEMISRAILAFGLFNSAVNPFVYAFKHQRFKEELHKMVTCKKKLGIGTNSFVPSRSM